MKLVAEIVYGEHRARWFYNVARFQNEDHLVLGVMCEDPQEGTLLGCRIDRALIEFTGCGHPRYGAPVDPGGADAVVIPAAAMRHIRIRDAGDGNRGRCGVGGYFVARRGDAHYLLLVEPDPDGNPRGCLLDPAGISPDSDACGAHTYSEPLDLKHRTVETLPRDIMLDRLTVLDLPLA